ncbi:cell envelope integrity protein CreD [Falsiroseomonas sp. HW251]|uniref:cell envelope integrity protein CreD n=1 Tax=Falsiroseomonas sp. HW251 TaxID=3390998 RepID=UPI003D320D5D
MSDAIAAPPLATPGRFATTRKVLTVLGMLLLLTVPQWMIGDLIEEREGRRAAVQAEIARGWAGPQTVFGPALVIPWRAPVQRDANGAMTTQRGSVAVLPSSLRASADLAPETRRRGLFEATVYLARLGLAGSFALPEVSVPGVPEAELLWSEAYLIAGSNELRPAGMAPLLTFDGRGILPGEIEPDIGLCGPQEALRWPLGLDGPPEPGRPLAFDLRLELRGSTGFGVVPVARRSTIAIAGAWPTPSFRGAELPARSSVEEAGFEAEWSTGLRVPVVRRNLGACRNDAGLMAQAVGVDLPEAVPTYRMVSRASKYTLFFLALTFVTCAIFELTARVRLHAVQYGLLGASVVLFPLLLLAIGEPLGFTAAYALAAAMVVLQASIYTAVVTRPTLGLVLAGVLAALFGFLHVVLSLEAYALLVGTLALFTALSVVMAVTRKVRWHAG